MGGGWGGMGCGFVSSGKVIVAGDDGGAIAIGGGALTTISGFGVEGGLFSVAGSGAGCEGGDSADFGGALAITTGGFASAGFGSSTIGLGLGASSRLTLVARAAFWC